jgi:hypothetical protein
MLQEDGFIDTFIIQAGGVYDANKHCKLSNNPSSPTRDIFADNNTNIGQAVMSNHTCRIFCILHVM